MESPPPPPPPLPSEKKLDIDFLQLSKDKVSRNKDTDFDPPAELVITPTNHQSVKRRNNTWLANQTYDSPLRELTDQELHNKIASNQTTITKHASTLKDKGEKLFNIRDELAEELTRRIEEKMRRQQQQKQREEDDKRRQSRQSKNSSTPDKSSLGACNGFSEGCHSSQVHEPFANRFSEALEKKPDCRSHIKYDPFEKELLCFNSGHHESTRRIGKLSKKNQEESNVSSGLRSLNTNSFYSANQNDHKSTKGSQNIDASRLPLSRKDRSVPIRFSKRRKNSRLPASLDSKTRKSELVLVDEDDEDDCVAIGQPPVEWDQDKIFYYPTRDNPESVEIRYIDIKCLEPTGYLSSNIMNFYIRYLQRPKSATGRSRSDYHFFNTYFYGKLKEAVLNKNEDNGTFFSKLRRWWKGINIFQKAYLLLPVHEVNHWSLVIICIPDKKAELGPIILHFDSLSYHNSKEIFQNIRSFLQEEWFHLKNGNDHGDIPIDEIWKKIPCKIEDKNIKVPQQKNDYDCGIFVLFYMERFVEEAPKRLVKKDLAKFGRQWFKPEEASLLRRRIRELVAELFMDPGLEN